MSRLPPQYPQPGSLGCIVVGVDAATPVGSLASHQAVLDFSGGTETLFTAPTIPAPITIRQSQTEGMSAKVNIPGLWIVHAVLLVESGAPLVVGAINYDGNAADLTTLPVGQLSARTRGRAAVQCVAAGQQAEVVPRAFIRVTSEDARDPNRGILRVLGSAGAGVIVTPLPAPLAAAGLFAAFRASEPPDGYTP